MLLLEVTRLLLLLHQRLCWSERLEAFTQAAEDY